MSCEHGTPDGVACLPCHAEALRIVHGCYDADTEEHGPEPCDICPDDETRAEKRDDSRCIHGAPACGECVWHDTLAAMST